MCHKKYPTILDVTKIICFYHIKHIVVISKLYRVNVFYSIYASLNNGWINSCTLSFALQLWGFGYAMGYINISATNC